MDSTDSNATIPMRGAVPAPKDLVTISLSEIQRLRDDLARLRHHAPMIRKLFDQWAGIYQRLVKQLVQKN